MKSCPGETTYARGAREQMHRGGGGQGHFQDRKILWTPEGKDEVYTYNEIVGREEARVGFILMILYQFVPQGVN